MQLSTVLSKRVTPAVGKSFVAEEGEEALYETRGRREEARLNATLDCENETNKCAWAAGVLDIHGTFKSSPVQVRVTGAYNPAVLRRLLALFGGNIYPANGTHGGVWVLTSKRRVSRLVAAILPHITVTRRAELKEKFGIE